MMTNRRLAAETLEATAVLIEAAELLWNLADARDYPAMDRQAEMMEHIIETIIAFHAADGIPFSTAENIADSLRRVRRLGRARSYRTIDKIAFEVLPLLKDLYLSYCFFNCRYPDRELVEHYFQNEMIALGSNRYIDDALAQAEYRYDLSIGVLAFNKLEYTKLCVEALLKQLPQDLTYELILINHGSSDGTKEFFEGIAPTKQLDIVNNGFGLGAYERIIEGKYYLEVSNDVLVTPYAVRNMIRCMESDDKIAWVVPTTPNVSNHQTIPATYGSLEEMFAFAAKNNRHADPYRWEQRSRLCNPISLKRSSVAFSSHGVHWSIFIHTDLAGGFIDDKEALFYRRNGYKMMLAKDSFCHHFGSVTLKEELAGRTSFYDMGRTVFREAFGIDPWGTGFCWSPELMSLLPCQESSHVDILGINSGLGSNPLKIKESLKENVHNCDVRLCNASDDESYRQDLLGVSDAVEIVSDSNDLARAFAGLSFDYIVLEGTWESSLSALALVHDLTGRLKATGFLAVQVRDSDLRERLLTIDHVLRTSETWVIISPQPAGDGADRQKGDQ